jgi:hypothetical protein
MTVPPSAGSALTLRVNWQTLCGVALLRGVGEPVEKLAELSSVSSQPAKWRSAAVVLLSAGAGLVSEQLADP